MGDSMGDLVDDGMAAYRSCGGMTVKRDVCRSDDTLALMELLKKFNNPVLLQITCDALAERGIGFRVDPVGCDFSAVQEGRGYHPAALFFRQTGVGFGQARRVVFTRHQRIVAKF